MQFALIWSRNHSNTSQLFGGMPFMIFSCLQLGPILRGVADCRVVRESGEKASKGLGVTCVVGANRETERWGKNRESYLSFSLPCPLLPTPARRPLAEAQSRGNCSHEVYRNQSMFQFYDCSLSSLWIISTSKRLAD